MKRNESSLYCTNYDMNKDENLAHEESFLSKLNLVKPDSVIISNPNLSFCEENGITKKELNFSNLNFSENLPNFIYDTDDEAQHINQNLRKTIGRCKKIKFKIDANSIDIFQKNPINNLIKDVNATPQFKKNKTRSFSSISQSQKKYKNKSVSTSRSIDDKYKQLSNRTKDNIISIKLNKKRDKSSDTLIKSKTQTLFKNYYTKNNNNMNYTSAHSLRVSYSKSQSNITKFLDDRNIDKSSSIIGLNNNHSKNNEIESTIEKIKELIESQENNFHKTFQKLLTNSKLINENKEKLHKEMVNEILIFVKNLYNEKFEKIFEIHSQYDSDLYKLEEMLDPDDVHNISHKIYHHVLDDKMKELKEIEIEYDEKKSKGIEQIEKNFEIKMLPLKELNEKNFNEDVKYSNEDILQQITKILKKNENSKTSRKNFSLTNTNSYNYSGNGIEIKENNKIKSKRNKPAFRV